MAGHEIILKLETPITPIISVEDQELVSRVCNRLEDAAQRMSKALAEAGRISFQQTRGQQPAPLTKTDENGRTAYAWFSAALNEVVWLYGVTPPAPDYVPVYVMTHG